MFPCHIYHMINKEKIFFTSSHLPLLTRHDNNIDSIHIFVPTMIAGTFSCQINTAKINIDPNTPFLDILAHWEITKAYRSRILIPMHAGQAGIENL